MSRTPRIGAGHRAGWRLGARLGALLAVLAPCLGAAAETGGKPAAGAAGRVLLVGPDRPYKMPSQAAAQARNGDTIRIDAGEYRDCAVWRTGNLTIEGVGGFAHIRDISCEGKALWVFYASPVTIRQIRFSGADVVHRNGAGIRWEGHGRLTVDKTWFHNNQMGILTHNEKASSLVVLDSRFEANGDCDTFCGHGVYAGSIQSLVVRSSRFEGHKFGHHIKSRAGYTQILGTKIIDGPDGTASFSIDLPNSGTADIRYNLLQKGAKSDNFLCVICIGEEIKNPDQRNPSRGILIESNSFQNDSGSPNTRFVWNRGPHPVTMRSNDFSGPGHQDVTP